MGRLFGTDGIRGVANVDLSAELALDVGRAVAVACREGAFGQGPRVRPRVVIGQDTRPSGPFLSSGLVAGLCSAGADVLPAGVIPTPGVAYLTRTLDADAGIVLSASHNPPADNGIKLFGPGGWKLSQAVEDVVESLMGKPQDLPTGDQVGRVVSGEARIDDYIAHLVASGSTLQGLRVALDCGHGAAHRVAPEVLRRLGAEPLTLHATGDGERINDGCGATHPEVVAEVARREGIVGLTFDGDADRVLACDEEGNIVDGDGLIALLAQSMRDSGTLAGDAIVTTVMANQALRMWCKAEGIRLVESPVGDRYVLEALREQDLVLGGEQSGHIIRLDRATTGDGVLTGVGLLQIVAHRGRLADLVPFRPLPQVLVNVETSARTGWRSSPTVEQAIEHANGQLGEEGRVLVRPSGTEPLVRVMVEASTADQARQVASQIADAVRRSLDEEA
jgi:phosphoglucosamine mutase